MGMSEEIQSAPLCVQVLSQLSLYCRKVAEGKLFLEERVVFVTPENVKIVCFF